jgi:hypothetical protein
MATAYTSLLGLALPVTGELSGTWGATVNDEITALLDSAVAGTTSITADADITLSDTDGAANETRQAVILWNPATGTTTRNITAPARSKAYIVINASGGTQSIVLRGAGPTTGVTIVKGESAVCAWNGSDFVKVANQNGIGNFTTVDTTNLEVTNIKAKDGTASITLADSTGIATFSKATIVETTDNTNAALRITQLGTGNALLVEDSSNPDSTPFVIDNAGNVGIGTSAPDANLEVSEAGSGLLELVRFTARDGATNHRFQIGVNDTDNLVQLASTGTSAGGFTFLTGATERMRITSDGNVGIGITPEASNTWISGSVIPAFEIARSTNLATALIKSYSTSSSSGAVFALAHSKSNTVGTETATASGDEFGYVSFEGVNSSLTAGGGAYIVGSQSGAAGATYLPTDLIFHTSDGVIAPAARMTITSAGNVGIGAANNAYNFNTANSNTTTGASQYSIAATATLSGTTFSASFLSQLNIPTGITAVSAAGLRIVNPTLSGTGAITNNYGIYIDDQTSGTNDYGIRSLVSSGANKFNLYIDGTAANYFAGQAQFANGSVGTPSISNINDTNTGIYFPAADTIGFAEGGAEAMRIDSSGRLLVGTTDTTGVAGNGVKIKSNAVGSASSVALTLEGTGGDFYALKCANVDMSLGSISSGGSPYWIFGNATNSLLLLYVNGNVVMPTVYGKTVTTPRNVFIDSNGTLGGISSVRASKNNITPITDSAWLYQVSPVTFNYRKRDEDGNYLDEVESEIQYGLIAEDVEAVRPEFCIYVEKDGQQVLQGVHYDRMISPLIKAIQEQQALIQTLTDRITALEQA